MAGGEQYQPAGGCRVYVVHPSNVPRRTDTADRAAPRDGAAPRSYAAGFTAVAVLVTTHGSLFAPMIAFFASQVP